MDCPTPVGRELDVVHMAKFDPLGEELAENFWEQMSELRECPVDRTELYGGIWILSKYADVLTAARDWESFSSAKGSGVVPRQATGDVRPIPIDLDPPLHRDFRRLIDRHFGPKAVAGAESEVRQVAVELIERFQGSGKCDFVRDFATPFPLNAFFQFALGTDMDEAEKVMQWLDKMLVSPTEGAEAMLNYFEWAKGLLDKRREGERRGDVLDSLLEGSVQGRELTDRERQMVIMNVVTGGIETTTHALSNAVYHLAASPEIRRRLNEDRTLIPAAIEEFLRYESPAPSRGRTATCPVQIDGADIKEGERILLFFGAANRDPLLFESPEEIVLDRYRGEANPHLSFGAGPHRCPGAHFARLEMKVALEEILDRLPNLDLDTDHLEYGAGITRGLLSLPLKF
jgi:cytochrome P450